MNSRVSIVIRLLIPAIVFGCGKPVIVESLSAVEEGLIGRWETDKEASDTPDGFWYEFGPGAAFAEGKIKTTQGTWQVVKKEGETVIVEVTQDGMATLFEIVVINQDQISLDYADGFRPKHLRRAGPIRVAKAGAGPAAPSIPEQDRQAVAALLKIKGCVATAQQQADRTVLNVCFTGKADVTDATVAQLPPILMTITLPIALDLAHCKGVTEACLRPLGRVPNLWSLNLIGVKISDAGLSYFEGAINLTGLQVEDLSLTKGGEFTDAGLAHLAGLTRMESLHLVSDEITDTGLAHLAKMTKLRSLWVATGRRHFSKVTEGGYVHLKGMTRLETVHMGHNLGDLGLSHMKGMNKLRELWVGGFDGTLTDAGMAHLKQFTELRALRVHGPKLTTAGLAQLEELKQLESLTLFACPAAAESLAFVKRLGNLHVLEITDSGTLSLPAASQLAEGSSKLELLDLDSGGVTSEGCAHLSRLTGLKVLRLRKSPLDDTGLRHLANLINLEALTLDETNITDAGLAHLTVAKNLRSLAISETGVTDAGLIQLKDLKRLAEVTCWKTNVTEQGSANLKKELPGVSIFWK